MVIGVTGSIATGKSTFSRYIKEHGYILVDSDQLSYDALTIDSSCINAVFALFDCKDPEGKIDRKKLAGIVFNDPVKKKQLEDIVHPYVLKHIQAAVEKHQDEIVFLDIPLLYEGHFEYLCDKIVVIYVNEKLQLKRLLERNHYSLEEAYARINNQISIEQKAKRADYVINNEGDLETLYTNIQQFLNALEKGEVAWKN